MNYKRIRVEERDEREEERHNKIELII